MNTQIIYLHISTKYSVAASAAEMDKNYMWLYPCEEAGFYCTDFLMALLRAALGQNQGEL